MVLSRSLVKKRRGRRPLAALSVLTVFLGTFLIAGIALAVHDLAFQLDGDVTSSTTTHVGPLTQAVDWDSLFDADGNKKALPADFTASGFKRDFNTVTKRGQTVFDTNDDSIYTTGSKDTLDINPGWQCKAANNVLTKNDIMNAYVAAYTNPVADANPKLPDGVTPNPNFGKHHQILYFGLERNGNNGDANVAFWFLQGPASCDTANGSWQGHHTDGDVLIVSAFTNGGGVSGITAYRWNGGANGSLGTTAVGNGGDCQGASGLDAICATTNGSAAPGLNAAITTPWLTANTADNVGHTLQPSEFFEGGIDLTTENLGGKCFNTFVGDTRSSQSLTATIFDYAAGTLGECTSTTQTTPKQGDGTPIPAGGLPIGASASVPVRDQALVTVTGIDTWSGTVTFSLCGPLDLASTGNCATGGVQIGSPVAVSNPSPATVNSPIATLTQIGRYCWRAVFSGDSVAGVPGSSDPKVIPPPAPPDTSTTECFKVNPLQPTLRTHAGTSPVDFGSSVTDTATLTGTANEPATNGITGSTSILIPPTASNGAKAHGTITFTLYKADCSTLATGTGTNPQTISLTTPFGDGTYPLPAGSSVSFQPDAPGTYHWFATYSGDSPNTLNSTATDLACGADPNEDVIVRTIPTEIKSKQSWIPNDTATITSTVGNLAAGGTVAFGLYDNSTCSGSALYTESKTLTGGAATEEVGTTNTTAFKITTGYLDPAGSIKGAYSWKVVYTPAAADTAHTGKQSSCDAEHFSITYTNDPGPGSNLP